MGPPMSYPPSPGLSCWRPGGTHVSAPLHTVWLSLVQIRPSWCLCPSDPSLLQAGKVLEPHTGALGPSPGRTPPGGVAASCRLNGGVCQPCCFPVGWGGPGMGSPGRQKREEEVDAGRAAQGAAYTAAGSRSGGLTKNPGVPAAASPVRDVSSQDACHLSPTSTL